MRYWPFFHFQSLIFTSIGKSLTFFSKIKVAFKSFKSYKYFCACFECFMQTALHNFWVFKYDVIKLSLTAIIVIKMLHFCNIHHHNDDKSSSWCFFSKILIQHTSDATIIDKIGLCSHFTLSRFFSHFMSLKCVYESKYLQLESSFIHIYTSLAHHAVISFN